MSAFPRAAAIAIVLFVCLAASSSSARGQSCARFPGVSPVANGALRPAHERDRVVGVFDDVTGQAIGGVAVVDLRSGRATSTGEAGVAALDFLSRPLGTQVMFRKIGYVPIDTVLTCGAGDTTDITLMMKRGTALPTVTTTAQFDVSRDAGTRAGFFDRCDVGRARCIGPADLDKYPARLIGDLLRARGEISSGVCRVTQQSILLGATRSCGTMSGKFGGKCTPTEYLNGMRWNGEPSLLAPANATPPPPFNAGDVAGIEVYRAGARKPLRWVGGGGDFFDECGTIVVWLK